MTTRVKRRVMALAASGVALVLVFTGALGSLALNSGEGDDDRIAPSQIDNSEYADFGQEGQDYISSPSLSYPLYEAIALPMDCSLPENVDLEVCHGWAPWSPDIALSSIGVNDNGTFISAEIEVIRESFDPALIAGYLELGLTGSCLSVFGIPVIFPVQDSHWDSDAQEVTVRDHTFQLGQPFAAWGSYFHATTAHGTDYSLPDQILAHCGDDVTMIAVVMGLTLDSVIADSQLDY